MLHSVPDSVTRQMVKASVDKRGYTGMYWGSSGCRIRRKQTTLGVELGLARRAVGPARGPQVVRVRPGQLETKMNEQSLLIDLAFLFTCHWPLRAVGLPLT